MFEAKEEKKWKGIKKAVIKKNITYKDYKTAYFAETWKWGKLLLMVTTTPRPGSKSLSIKSIKNMNIDNIPF